MIKLVDLLLEDYPKGQYIPLDGKEKEQAQKDLFDLIDNAYKSIGGHVKFKKPSDVMDPELQYWRAADLDDDPELDVVYFGKVTPFGVKHTGIGHDGDRGNVKSLLIRKSGELKSSGNYVEVSGAAFDSFVGNIYPVSGVMITDDEAVYVYTGYQMNQKSDYITISPSFALGYYDEGDDDIDLRQCF